MWSPTVPGEGLRRLASRAAAALAIALLSACATSREFERGRTAEQQHDYDRAVVEYTRALKERPDDKNVRYALDRARLRASQDHFQRGRRLEATGRYEEALLELQLAAELNPSNADVDKLLQSTRLALRNKIAVSREGKTRLETLVDHTREAVPPGLELPKDLRVPASMVFREASNRDVLIALARWANVNITFDPAFRENPITIEFRNSTFEDALASVTATTRTFYRVTAPRTVTIVPDTPAKRREYEEEIVRTFYLSNAELKETIDLLRIVVDARRVAGMPGTNAITIKDSPDRIAAASRVIAAIDKARPEVVIDVELLEVDRTRLKEYGLQVASPGSPGISGSADVNREGLTLRDLRTLTQSDVFLTGVPALFYRLLKSDTNTRILANPQLRTTDGVAATARFGERVPVPVTTFAPIATGGVPQQPITSFNYENIGVNIDITPRTHHNDDVSLAMKVEVSSISGQGTGATAGLPTFGNRSINTVLRLRDGETNVFAGLIRDDERVLVEGVPGLSDLPGIGRLFTHTKKEAQETDILLTLTPHVVRVLDLGEADLLPFRVRSGAPTPLVEMPPAEQPAPPRDQLPPQQPPQPQQPPPAGSQPVLPIVPPTQPAPQPQPTPQEPPDDQTPPGLM
jgi:general secretion pathway protein D